MSISEQDVAALHRVLDAINSDPALVQSSELAALRKWARQHGAHFSHDAAAAAHQTDSASTHHHHNTPPPPQPRPEEQDQFYNAAATQPPPPPHHTTPPQPTAADPHHHHSYPSAHEHAAPHEQLGHDKDDNDKDEDDTTSEPDPERWTLESEEAVMEDVPSRTEEPTETEVEQAMAAKTAAVELEQNGHHAEAIAKLSEALKLTPRNAMYWGLRAQYQLRQHKPKAALHDADRALSINPQNVRALRVRGTVRRHLGDWEAALKDLNEAQTIDYDDETGATMRFVQGRVGARHQRHIRQQEAEARRQQEAAKRQRQEQQQQPHAGAGGFPGSFVPPGMEALFSDPDLLAALQDPEVGPKLMQSMRDPASIMTLMQDPKVGPVLTKLMSKLGGAMPGARPPPQQQSPQQHAAPHAQGSSDNHEKDTCAAPKPTPEHRTDDLD